VEQAYRHRGMVDLPAAASHDPYLRYRFIANGFAFVIVAAAVVELIWNFRHPTSRDFVSFWGAAQLALQGRAPAAYDNAVLHAVQSAVAVFSPNSENPFPYPPAYLLLVMPFGLLSFPVAMAAWALCTFGFYLYGARKLMPQSGWLAAAFPTVFANAAAGQNGFLTAGILMTGLSMISRRPLLAGMVLGCMVIKPQLALLLPVALVAGRRWRVIAGGAISSIAIMLLGMLSFGLPAMAAWIHQLPLYAALTRDGLVGWSKLASVYAAARELGLSPGCALAVNAVFGAAGAAAVWHMWRSSADEGARVAIAAAATGLASPYLLFYDTLCVVPAFVWLIRQNERPAVLLALWCLPLLQIAQIGAFDTGLNLNAVAPAALTGLVYWRWRQGEQRRGSDLPAGGLTIRQPSTITLS
jgi:hypothetical protein